MRGVVFAVAAVALGAVLLLALPGADEAAPPPAPPASSPPPQRGPAEATAPRAPAAAPAPPAAEPALPPATASGLAARDARLARAAGLRPGGETATARLLRSYSADELALLARFEALARAPSAPALEELILRRRAGASAAALGEAATRLFAGDPLARAAALEWVRTARAPGGARAAVTETGAEPR